MAYRLADVLARQPERRLQRPEIAPGTPLESVAPASLLAPLGAHGIEVPIPAVAPHAPGLLTPEEVYAWWLARLSAGEAEVIETWPRIYLAARSIGLTRLGSGHYRPAKFKEACERLVREGRAVRFWLVQRGRPRRAATTMTHIWAWGLAGFHRRLGRRGSTR